MTALGQAPSTSRSLLRRLQDGPAEVDWGRFERLYGPVIYAWARRRGVKSEDADDVTQQVLAALMRAMPRWDPGTGSFRGWLWTITVNKIRDFRRAESRRERASGDSGVRHLLNEIEAPAGGASAQWDDEFDNDVLAGALRLLRPDFTERSWRAFEMTVVEGRPPAEVAGLLGIKLHSVYKAKSRILSKLREELDGLIE